ncbi:hypothetical protein [Paraburkholderia sp.]|uniref:hypothetical protein n=1 Tax=Paraburkholderia sp. TaxID=1926495 RepID=UPI00286EE0F2|nr:hypothetical protein [Paraburkholderia sp.]
MSSEWEEDDGESGEREEAAPELVGPRLPSASGIAWRVYPRRRVNEDGLRGTMEHRANVLFGHELPRDPQAGLSFKRTASAPFQIVPSEFLRRAQRMRPEDPQATVSAFSQWIYSLYASAYGDEEDRERGKAREPLIYQTRLQGQGGVHNGFLRSIGSEWRLIHNGLHMPGQDHVDYFTIDSLRVNGEALRAAPDLIYRHPRFNEVMVVEIKNSWMTIPSNLWPNIWGQLWCYAQLDVARNANRVTVIGEVWGEHKIWVGRGRKREEYESVYLRACERRDPRAPAYDRFFRALFDIYCGRSGI